MFSFHKPKIYRSNLGCCICKAKSSSSRFTDSKKYENEFERCFRIQEKRSGEICNACVLLVKRWKKLSPENRLIKHWHHVVDARAGPGTKLTAYRRLTSSNAASGNGGNNTNEPSLSSSSPSSSLSSLSQSNTLSSSKRQAPNKGDVLPLSSSQVSNQTSTSSNSGNSRRTINKACAIDTNVSTFTFGELPTINRRNYTDYSASTYSSINKPHSSLNSSAFESVIKRFRQRQQQQQIEAQRRQQRQLRQHQLQLKPATRITLALESTATTATNSSNKVERVDSVASLQKEPPTNKQQVQQNQKKLNAANTNASQLQQPPAKRPKRLSESIGSICIDGVRVSAYLDSALWRKEKVCCGIIFRGLYDEVAVFPKLLKPCQCRLAEDNRLNERMAQDNSSENHQTSLTEASEPSPRPRANKSGSISSCDSNTSGTGSMEQQTLEEQAICRSTTTKATTRQSTPKVRSSKRHKMLADTDSNVSNSSSAFSSLCGTSSFTFGRLSLEQDNDDEVEAEVDDDEEEDGGHEDDFDEDEDGRMTGLDEDESSTDATSSSVESLTNEMQESKKGGAVSALG